MVAADSFDEVPAELVAVATERRYLPASEAVTVYVDEVAPLMSE